MLFNSYPFVFLFFPAVVVGFFAIGIRRPVAATVFLAVASLAFYAHWNLRFLPILIASIVANYLVGVGIGRTREAAPAMSRRLLAAGVVGNLAALAYYKYADFLIMNVNTVAGGQIPLLQVALPLGISFFTFTQLAFLVDTYRGQATEYRFIHYLLLVSYFPHLIAGPILHHREIIPQFAALSTYRPHAVNFAIGITIFAFGLFKKVVIADALIPDVHAAFEPRDGGQVGFFVAWTGALAYTFQIYFDFSGYCDMAFGLSRIFGVTLPLNFYSPYKARSIIEFWHRWHMTLSRFLRDYLYIPLGGNRLGRGRRYLNLMATMLLGGLWHGASWTFVLWGGLHGGYLAVNHAWTAIRGANRPRSRVSEFIGWAITFSAVVVAWVFFRAADLNTAFDVLAGMAGLNGWGSNEVWEEFWSAAPRLARLLLLLAIVALAPNVYEVMPASPSATESVKIPGNGSARWLTWAPTLPWALGCGVMLLISLAFMGRMTEFLYFRF